MAMAVSYINITTSPGPTCGIGMESTSLRVATGIGTVFGMSTVTLLTRLHEPIPTSWRVEEAGRE